MRTLSQDDIVDRIYEAAVLPDCWPDVLAAFATAADSLEGVMVSAKGEQVRWLGSSPVAEAFVEGNYRHEGGMERTRRLLSLGHPGFVTDRDLFSDAEIHAMPVYADYLIPNGFGRGTATVINVPDSEHIIFHAEGDYGHGPYDRAVLDRLDGLRPHLARSAMLASRLSFERARTSVETLAALGFAACAVRDNGTVLVANAEFERGAAFWTTRFADRVALQDRRADRQLAGTLALIAGDAGVRSIAARPLGEGAPAVLHVVPIRRAAHDLFNQAAAILVLTMTVPGQVVRVPLLQALFDLTATEADLASRIGAGHTVQQVALSEGKGVETVRSQLKRVFAKTGCRRQIDLVRLLGQLVLSNL